jgi:hypothetical protein
LRNLNHEIKLQNKAAKNAAKNLRRIQEPLVYGSFRRHTRD